MKRGEQQRGFPKAGAGNWLRSELRNRPHSAASDAALPSPKYPSDHISLVVDFKMFEQ